MLLNLDRRLTSARTSPVHHSYARSTSHSVLGPRFRALPHAHRVGQTLPSRRHTALLLVSREDQALFGEFASERTTVLRAAISGFHRIPFSRYWRFAIDAPPVR